jgi:hypothetical protein
MNASLYKAIKVNEHVLLRINLDAFNVFNHPGMPLPDSNTGIISLRTSGQVARVLQYTARLTW